MSSKTRICPICKKKFNVQGFMSHYKSERCKRDAKGIPIGIGNVAIYIDESYPETIYCELCGKQIKSEYAVFLKGTAQNCFHGNHITPPKKMPRDNIELIYVNEGHWPHCSLCLESELAYSGGFMIQINLIEQNKESCFFHFKHLDEDFIAKVLAKGLEKI